MADDGSTGPPRSWRYHVVNLALFAFISGFISFAVMIGTTFFTSHEAHSRQQVKNAEYGFPVAWVHQDQTTVTDSGRLPSSSTMLKPEDVPTDARWSALLLDLLIVGAMPGAAYLVVTGAIRVIRRAAGRPSGVTTAIA